MARLDSGDILIEPFDRALLKRNSYLLQLGSEYRRLSSRDLFDSANPKHYEDYAGELWTGQFVDVEPDTLILATSSQRVGVGHNLVGVLSGISNVARLGVQVHCTSAFVNAGYGMPNDPGHVVFEMATVGGRRVRMYPGTPICHLAFLASESPAQSRKPSDRSGQSGPDPSSLFSQFGDFYAR